MDTFDKTVSHEGIIFESDTKIRRHGDMNWDFTCAIGSGIIGKGDKQTWIFKAETPSIIVGIIDNKMVNSERNIFDHTGLKYKYNSYGIGMYSRRKYHGDRGKARFRNSSKFEYMNQFNLKTNHRVFTMELDMTQKLCPNGILSFIMHHQAAEDVTEIKAYGEYTNAAWVDIDIDKQYRMAVTITTGKQSVELLSQTPTQLL